MAAVWNEVVSSTCSPINIHTNKLTYFGTCILLNFSWSQRGRCGSLPSPTAVITFPSILQRIIIFSCMRKPSLSTSSFPPISNTLRYPILYPYTPANKKKKQQNKTKQRTKDPHLDPKSFSHYYGISLLIFIKFLQQIFWHLSCFHFLRPFSLDFCPTMIWHLLISPRLAIGSYLANPQQLSFFFLTNSPSLNIH